MDSVRAERLAKKYAGTKVEQKKTMFGRQNRRMRNMVTGKPKDAKGTMRRLMHYLSKDKARIAIVLICVILNTAASITGSYLLRPIINTYIVPINGMGDLKGLLRSLIVMGIIYLIGAIAAYLQFRIMQAVSQRALKNIRSDLFCKIQKLPIKFFDTNNHGEIMSRFTNDVDAIGEMLNNTIIQLVSGITTLVGTFSLMLYTNVYLSLITLVMIPIFAKSGRTVTKHSRRFYNEQQTALGILNGYVEETVTGQKVVKVFCHEEIAEEEFAYLNNNLRAKQVNAQFFGSIMGPIMHNISNINYALTASIGGILCVVKNFDLGGLTVFANYSRQFSRPINELSMQVNTIFSALAGAERVFDIMDRDPEPADDADAVELDRVKGNVVLNNVTFGYDAKHIVLKNISLQAKPGQKIALVGSTGAGKTTITNLLTRFYDVQQGSITIDGVPLEKIKRENLRKQIAMVLQDTHLFTGTVMENIRYGRLDATDEEVIAAAKTASAHSFIIRLEKGYDTMLEGDGANLSQGQRQLLNIARAAISKAPILILDEATSSVDTRTEKQIERGMDHLMEDRTTFVIAHRLSTVRNSDIILVLENGEIIERGTHDELLTQKGRYYELYTGLAELD